MHTLYMILSEVTPKVYIGQTTNPDKRWARHLYEASAGKGYAIHNAMRKYGIDAFDFIILDTYETKEQVDEAEIRFIARSKAQHKSYNIAPGGEGLGSGENHPQYGKTLTVETKAKMSKSRKGKYTGEANSMYGKTHSAEAKTKMSESRTGENNPSYKYPPELIASFPNQKTATEATGISKAQYYKLKRDNPKLTWLVIASSMEVTDDY